MSSGGGRRKVTGACANLPRVSEVHDRPARPGFAVRATKAETILLLEDNTTIRQSGTAKQSYRVRRLRRFWRQPAAPGRRRPWYPQKHRGKRSTCC